jgi:hypothetical protein
MLTRLIGFLLVGAAVGLLLASAPARTADFTATSWNDLLYVIGAAEVNPGPDTISLEGYHIIMNAETAPAQISSDVTIVNGILDGSTAASMPECFFVVMDGAHVTFEQLTVQNCITQIGAVVVNPDCTLTATDCTFQDNDAPIPAGFMGFMGLEFFGGAITCLTGTVELTDCTFAGNHAVSGGAIALSANPWTYDPSAVGMLTASGCTFDGNTADIGGGAVMMLMGGTAQFTGCAFTENTAGQAGGAILDIDINMWGGGTGTGTLELSECTFSNNAALLGEFAAQTNGPGVLGGAVMCMGIGSATNCLFTGNGAYASHTADDLALGSEIDENVLAIGGALITMGEFTCANCVFTDNSVYGENTSEEGYVYAGGGAWAGIGLSMMDPEMGPLRAVNCTFYGNSVATSATTINYNLLGESSSKPNIIEAGGGVVLVMGEMYNCILWGNTLNGDPDQFSDLTGLEDFALAPPSTVICCDVQGGWATGVNIIDDDPDFVAAPDDLSLSAGSPCIDAGYTDIVTELGLTVDLAGNPRVVNDAVDLGAYEFQGTNAPPVLTLPAAAFTVIAGNALTFTATATDPDEGDTLTFSLVGAPAGAAIDPDTGAFALTPTTVGAFTFEVKVTDAGGLSDTETVTMTVVSALTISDVTVTRRNGKVITVTVQINNPSDETAYDTTVTAATLNGSDSNSPLPLIYGAIKPGKSKQCTLQFKDVEPGEWPLTIEGTCSLGLISWSGMVNVP